MNGASPTSTRIAHLDIDAFYASVELLRYPHLRGLPVVIGGRQALRSLADAKAGHHARLREDKGRGVVNTAPPGPMMPGPWASIPRWGSMKATLLAPNAILIPMGFEQYRHCSQLFKPAVAAIAPQVNERGIDEIRIHLSGLCAEKMLLIGASGQVLALKISTKSSALFVFAKKAGGKSLITHTARDYLKKMVAKPGRTRGSPPKKSRQAAT